MNYTMRYLINAIVLVMCRLYFRRHFFVYNNIMN